MNAYSERLLFSFHAADYARGKKDQAIKLMNKFLDQLCKENKNNVSDQAKSVLRLDANSILASWK